MQDPCSRPSSNFVVVHNTFLTLHDKVHVRRRSWSLPPLGRSTRHGSNQGDVAFSYDHHSIACMARILSSSRLPARTVAAREGTRFSNSSIPSRTVYRQHLPASAMESCPSPSRVESRTTMMMRNIPRDFSRQMLLELLETKGCLTLLDFLYVPINGDTNTCVGYACVNVARAEDAVCLFGLAGYSTWADSNHDGVLEVVWSDSSQGLGRLIERYRNSPLMHRSVADVLKPIMLQDGVRVAFDSPSRQLHCPKWAQDQARNNYS